MVAATPGLRRALRALATGPAQLVALVEGDGTLAYVGPSVTRLLGYDGSDLVGTSVLPLLHPDDLGMAVSMLDAAAPGPGPTDDADIAGEYRLRHADGHWVPFEVVRSDHRDDLKVGAVLVIGRPILARRALDEALHALAHDEDGTEALRKLAEYLDVRLPGTVSAFVVTGAVDEWVTAAVAPALLATDGPWRQALSAEEPVYVEDLGAPAGVPESLRADSVALGLRACWCFPLPVRRPQVYSPMARTRRPAADRVVGCLVLWSSARSMPLAGQLGVVERVGGLADLALNRRATNRELRHLARHDQVTGALSRSGFEELAGRDEAATYLMIDLDDFKAVNDHHGHHVGDAVLRITAQRIQSLLRKGDALGRLGGDEFALRLGGTDLAAARAVADRVIDALAAPLSEDGLVIELKASVGIAPHDPAAAYEELIRRADVALYRAKRDGKGCWKVWTEQLPAEVPSTLG